MERFGAISVSMEHRFSPQDVVKLAAAACCNPKTARKWLLNEGLMKPSIGQRIAEAAKQLGLTQTGATK